MNKVNAALSFLTPTVPRPDRPLFVFLPGMDGTGTLLNTQVRDLSPWFDIRSLVLPREMRIGWPSLSHAVGALIETELKRSSSSRPVYLCGESFGGCLAQLVALRSPHLVDYLILVNPASSLNRQVWGKWAVDCIRTLPGFFYPLACTTFLPFLVNLSRIEATERHVLLNAMQDLGHDNAVYRVSLLHDFCLTEDECRQIEQPTLILVSERDRVLPSLTETFRLADLLPNTKIYRLPDSGHACLLEAEVKLSEILQDCSFGIQGDRSIVVKS